MTSRRAAFERAGADYRQTDLAPPAEALAVAAASLDRTGLFLLGESHGVAQSPLAILGLARRLGVRTLAFEWCCDELDAVVQPVLSTGRVASDAPLEAAAVGRGLLRGWPFHGRTRAPARARGRPARSGRPGRKGKGGFYRIEKAEGGKSKLAIDLASGEYRPSAKPSLASIDAAKAAKGAAGLRALVEHPDRGGRYGWRMLSRTLAYAASLVPGIALDVASVDEAMRCGYGWERGPFELLDKIGPAWFAKRLAEEGRVVPPLLATVGDGTFYRVEGGRLEELAVGGGYVPVRRPEGVLLLADLRRAGKPVTKNSSASIFQSDPGEYGSSDYRLSPFGALSGKLRIEAKLSDWPFRMAWKVGASYEHYESSGSLAILSVDVENPGLVGFDVFMINLTARF